IAQIGRPAPFFSCAARPPPRSTLFPYTTLFRSAFAQRQNGPDELRAEHIDRLGVLMPKRYLLGRTFMHGTVRDAILAAYAELNRSEEHTSELQSRENLVCRLLLEKKKKRTTAQL